MPRHDLIVVGAGVVGLAHALAAARRGKRVLVLDRDAQANGASIRNFGFVTVTGQERGRVWELAMRSAAIWREVAAPAGIAIEQEGLLLVAQRPEAAAVIEAFLGTEMGRGCTWLGPAALAGRWPMVRGGLAALQSPHDLRVDSPLAIPKLAAWLAATHAVDFAYGIAVHAVDTGRVHSSHGVHEADAVIVCPGDDWATLFPELYADAGITRCKLQMLRLAAPGWRLPAPVMSDLSMVRYLGYAALPEADVLRTRLEAEEAEALAHGVHLIAVQGADGSLVVGDSHDYAPTPDPFSNAAIDDAILDAYARVLGPPPAVIARWTGTYASAAGHSIVREPAPGVRLVVVTSGTGASTSFALAEDVVSTLFGSN
ncbi:TIGR03364 family FAD-dependent oxidoreductase [Sphingomonas kyeonggiensis]|uniref:FAD dependent oxidoreductase TIGR03364 n=1 Tax=Sphingomonas kyeonggiensis TaxID=1268553 RepID=A0A7W6JSB3_9SPHN|nr:TIGR03364 family FAD-dependent oxidoreductase [Sphingomonas kyeonggiensis]MBB4098651.1 FAD dependent oxidoreductase TIGR03364 [Sphingomonas kyeonggiensis]